MCRTLFCSIICLIVNCSNLDRCGISELQRHAVGWSTCINRPLRSGCWDSHQEICSLPGSLSSWVLALLGWPSSSGHTNIPIYEHLCLKMLRAGSVETFENRTGTTWSRSSLGRHVYGVYGISEGHYGGTDWERRFSLQIFREVVKHQILLRETGIGRMEADVMWQHVLLREEQRRESGVEVIVSWRLCRWLVNHINT